MKIRFCFLTVVVLVMIFFLIGCRDAVISIGTDSADSAQPTAAPAVSEETTEGSGREKTTAENHVHTYTPWETVRIPDCTHTGEMRRTCTICEQVQSKTIDALGHDYGGTLTCSRCGETRGDSVGLAFEKNTGGTYTLKDRGTCEDADIVIPATYQGIAVTEIGDYAFSGNGKPKNVSMTSVYIPDGVTRIGNEVFFGCRNLKSVRLPETLMHMGSLQFSYCDALKEITLPESLTDVDITAINGVPRVNIKDFGQIFKLRFSGTAIDAPGFFRGCQVYINGEHITSVTIPANVQTVSRYIFSVTSAFKEIVIPPTVTRIEQYAFQGSPLQSLTVPFLGERATNQSNLGYFFAASDLYGNNDFTNCNGRWIPKSLKTLTFTGDVFPGVSGCTMLKKVILTSTSLVELKGGSSTNSNDKGAFEGCTALTTVVLPEGLRVIGAWAFAQCEALKTVNLPEGVTTIGDHAFRNCEALKEITFPHSLTSVGHAVFEYLYNSVTVTYRGTEEEWNALGVPLDTAQYITVIYRPD